MEGLSLVLDGREPLSHTRSTNPSLENQILILVKVLDEVADDFALIIGQGRGCHEMTNSSGEPTPEPDFAS